MKLFIKLLSTIMYVVLFALFIYMFWDSDSNSMLNSDKGYLVAVASYFKDADTWSLIFFALTFGVGIGLFLGISFALDRAFKKIGSKYPKVNFINSDAADLFLQIPTAFVILIIVFVVGSNAFVSYRGNKLSTTDIQGVPDNSPVFVLGTSKYLASGGENLYYTYRMKAAEELWKSGKVKTFILSGDGVGAGHTEAYDETQEMREDLLKLGVPEDKIAIDKFGFNTQQSIIRLRGVFKLNNIVIVSQDFHNLRAVVLCDYYGIKSLGYNAKGSATFSMTRKETLISRPRIIVDMLYANMQPQVSDDGEFAYREDFSATKSNKHVLIIILMVILFVVAFIGIGTYRAKEGAERKKAAIRLSAITSAITVALAVLVFTTYKTLDIRFIDEIVETTASVVGVKTTKMEVKEEIFEKKKVEYEARKAAEPAEIVPISTTEIKEEKPEDKRVEAPAFNSAVSDQPVVEKQVVNTSSENIAAAKKEADDPFNSSEGDDSFSSDGDDSDEAPKKKITFNALVHDEQELVNDGTISLRLESPVTINGKQYSKNYVFEGKTILFNNRFIFVVDGLGEIEFRNFEGGKEGNTIQERHTGKKGSVVIADGEKIVFMSK